LTYNVAKGFTVFERTIVRNTYPKVTEEKMRLFLIGCEYSGTTTLAHAINEWTKETMDKEFTLIHDHFKLPDTKPHGPELTEEEIAQFDALSPRLTEVIMRHNLYYHTPAKPSSGEDFLGIGIHIEEGIYGPLYYGYGGPGELGDRQTIAKSLEQRILNYAPETVLILVKASPEVIAKRMKENPHRYPVVPEQDIPDVLQQFEDAHQNSSIRFKITLDTSTATIDETVAEFVEKIRPHLTEAELMKL
jgi:shikimate kinase